ncbi:MAG: 1-deoxy-D-xylulose-5-phosphate reductoisomerase, partial [Propionibacterium sp.]|nr:1-deoxy-D-xylulose-5-phosphate reductoisomerase [Propionibacterium sp.]
MACQTGRVRDIIILGSTGSIGTQALELIGPRRDEFRVSGLAAGGGNVELLARQVLDVAPDTVAVARATAVQDLQLALYAEAQRRGWSRGQVRLPKILAGPEAVTELAAMPCDVVLNGITGAAGLLPTLATLGAGTTLALANKESLVIGGRLVT